MQKKHFFLYYTLSLLGIVLLTASAANDNKWTETEKDSIRTVRQTGGATLGYSTGSGVKLLTVDGYAFKDLNHNGKLDPYEDWRLTPEERSANLASQLSIEEIAGLMLYSNHQSIPGTDQGFWDATYNGKKFKESGALPEALSDAQLEFLRDDKVRHILITKVQSPEIAARWNNNVQAFIEGLDHGIPANNSSDPRHGTVSDAEYNFGNGGQISLWPGSLGLAATFSPEIVRNFGHIAACEYRALGITTALSPQIDLASEPRWCRVNGTFGEDPALSTDMARAYIDGMQTSLDKKEISNGWGYQSVNAMVKHWPGGGCGEGGRDAHYGYGKYAVYPGNNLEEQKRPFLEGAFRLDGKTGKAAAVMPYYTISTGQNPDGENIANSYSHYLITDQLRNKYGYDGVVCTDWGITADETGVETFAGKPWGAEKLSVAERHYRILMAGVDQFGGNNDKEPVLEAYRIGVEQSGEKVMRERFETSARRLLLNIFRTGLFENPYLDPAESTAIVGNPDFMKAGYEAQLKSVVMLKNKNGVLPLDKTKKVYIPKRYIPAVTDFFGKPTEARTEEPVNRQMVEKYFIIADTPEEADFALVFIESPNSGTGYDPSDRKEGGNGYMPISLQYEDYSATAARDSSLAGGDPYESSVNRSYKGKTVKTSNKTDLLTVLETQKLMNGKPVIVSLTMNNPTVMSRLEPSADAILVNFGVQHQAIFDLISGRAEPSALLPLQMPADMTTVEQQAEDIPRDMQCYTDSEGNTYDFAFGMNWKGVIKDGRVTLYK